MKSLGFYSKKMAQNTAFLKLKDYFSHFSCPVTLLHGFMKSFPDSFQSSSNLLEFGQYTIHDDIWIFTIACFWQHINHMAVVSSYLGHFKFFVKNSLLLFVFRRSSFGYIHTFGLFFPLFAGVKFFCCILCSLQQPFSCHLNHPLHAVDCNLYPLSSCPSRCKSA